jgi:hypothetical protein
MYQNIFPHAQKDFISQARKIFANIRIIFQIKTIFLRFTRKLKLLTSRMRGAASALL